MKTTVRRALRAAPVLFALGALGCVPPPAETTPKTPTARAEEVGKPPKTPEQPQAQATEEEAEPTPAPTPPRPAAHGTPRPPRDVPDHFLTIAPSGAAREPSGGAACPGQVQDPRYSARLNLVRSHGGQGDYDVPPGKYGVGDGELLRIACGTGQAVSIVAR